MWRGDYRRSPSKDECSVLCLWYRVFNCRYNSNTHTTMGCSIHRAQFCWVCGDNSLVSDYSLQYRLYIEEKHVEMGLNINNSILTKLLGS